MGIRVMLRVVTDTKDPCARSFWISILIILIVVAVVVGIICGSQNKC